MFTSNAWRKGVVYRCFVTIFLNAYCAYCHLACSRSAVVKILLIYSPLTSHKVKTTKAHHYRMFKTSEEHTHETNARQVCYTTHIFLVIADRYSKLIPSHLFSLAISQFRFSLMNINDEIMSYLHIIRTNAHMILIVFLVFVESIVLIDVLNIRGMMCRNSLGDSHYLVSCLEDY